MLQCNRSKDWDHNKLQLTLSIPQLSIFNKILIIDTRSLPTKASKITSVFCEFEIWSIFLHSISLCFIQYSAVLLQCGQSSHSHKRHPTARPLRARIQQLIDILRLCYNASWLHMTIFSYKSFLLKQAQDQWPLRCLHFGRKSQPNIQSSLCLNTVDKWGKNTTCHITS